MKNKKKPAPSHGSPKPTPRGGPRKVADTRVFRQSRVTNGKTLLPFVDPRSHWARIMKAEFDRLVEHCGGLSVISETKLMQARISSVLFTELTFQASKFARTRAEGGEPAIADVDAFARIAGNHRRCVEPLGWERAQRDVTPDLKTYIASKYQNAEDADEMEDVEP